jgi:hypothetical protein
VIKSQETVPLLISILRTEFRALNAESHGELIAIVFKIDDHRMWIAWQLPNRVENFAIAIDARFGVMPKKCAICDQIAPMNHVKCDAHMGGAAKE